MRGNLPCLSSLARLSGKLCVAWLTRAANGPNRVQESLGADLTHVAPWCSAQIQGCRCCRGALPTESALLTIPEGVAGEGLGTIAVTRSPAVANFPGGALDLDDTAAGPGGGRERKKLRRRARKFVSRRRSSLGSNPQRPDHSSGRSGQMWGLVHDRGAFFPQRGDLAQASARNSRLTVRRATRLTDVNWSASCGWTDLSMGIAYVCGKPRSPWERCYW